VGRLPGTVLNFAEPGLARTGDGVPHVVCTRRNGTKEDLIHPEVSASGKVGADAVALGGWSAMSHPGLLRMSDGSLRAFFGGIRSTNPGRDEQRHEHRAAPASGTPWTLKPDKAAQATYAYATGVAGAGLAKDGTPISYWSGTRGLGFHYGTDTSTPDGKFAQSGCCLYNPEIAVDSASGPAWVGFYSNETASPAAGSLDLIVNDGQGLWHEQVWPKLSLTASRSGATIVFRITDAGDPLRAPA
jgi:hypothetical protein